MMIVEPADAHFWETVLPTWARDRGLPPLPGQWLSPIGFVAVDEEWGEIACEHLYVGAACKAFVDDLWTNPKVPHDVRSQGIVECVAACVTHATQVLSIKYVVGWADNPRVIEKMQEYCDEHVELTLECGPNLQRPFLITKG